MALEVETGTGNPIADSWVDDAYFVAYAAKVGVDVTADLPATREIWLRKAQMRITRTKKDRWKGRRVYELQALDWPRQWVKDSDGYMLPFNAIPAALKDAQCELALRAKAGDDLLPDVSNPGVISSTSVSAAGISESISYVNGSQQLKQYTAVDEMLRPLLNGSNGICISVERS